MAKLTGMQSARPSVRVQKPPRVAAGLGGLALSFASSNAVAVADEGQDEPEQSYCLHFGTNAISEGQQKAFGADAEQTTEPEDSDSDAPVLQDTPADSLRVATYTADISRDSSGN